MSHATEPGAKGCRVCGSPLNVLRHQGRATYQHPVPPADGHDPQPVPLTHIADPAWVCDFCSAPDPLWSYEFEGLAVVTISAGDLAMDANHLGHRWAACATCAALIDAGDQSGLTRRSLRTLLRDHGVRDPRISAELTLLHRRLLEGGRPPVRRPLQADDRSDPPGEPAEEVRSLPPTLMPKIRDRLADYWRHQARHDLTAAIAGGYLPTLPTHLTGAPHDAPATQPAPPDPTTLDAYHALMAHHIAQAPLYWIDPDYTTLATHAGTGLPDLTAAPHELPTTHGLLVWATPISRHHIPGTHQSAPIIAAHWGIIPDAVWVLFYTHTDLLHPTNDPAALQRLREHRGWLAPAHTGLALGHRRTSTLAAPDERAALATLIATWLLAAQPDTDTVTTPADKATRRAYARAGRLEPTIRMLRIRPRPQPERTDQTEPGDQPGRTYRHRWWVNGFWREQPYGPGRSLRRRTFVRGHMRSVDRTSGVSYHDARPLMRTLGSSGSGRSVGDGAGWWGRPAGHRGTRGRPDRQGPG